MEKLIKYLQSKETELKSKNFKNKANFSDDLNRINPQSEKSFIITNFHSIRPLLSSVEFNKTINKMPFKKDNLNLGIFKSHDEISKFCCEEQFEVQKESQNKLNYQNYSSNFLYKYYKYDLSKFIDPFQRTNSFIKKRSLIMLNTFQSDNLFNKFSDYLRNFKYNVLSTPLFDNVSCYKKLNQSQKFDSKEVCNFSVFSSGKFPLVTNIIKRNYILDLKNFYNKCFFPRQNRHRMREFDPLNKNKLKLKGKNFSYFSSHETHKLKWQRFPFLKLVQMTGNKPDELENILEGNTTKQQRSCMKKLIKIRKNIQNLNQIFTVENEKKNRQHLEFIEKLRQTCNSTPMSLLETEISLSSSLDQQYLNHSNTHNIDAQLDTHLTGKEIKPLSSYFEENNMEVILPTVVYSANDFQHDLTGEEIKLLTEQTNLETLSNLDFEDKSTEDNESKVTYSAYELEQNVLNETKLLASQSNSETPLPKNVEMQTSQSEEITYSKNDRQRQDNKTKCNFFKIIKFLRQIPRYFINVAIYIAVNIGFVFKSIGKTIIYIWLLIIL